jgi:phosphoribosylamine--glycine ligase
MNVAIIGSGGREHAIAYKISESKLLNKLFILPGNPGTSSLGENVNIDVNNHDSVISFCKKYSIDLVIIGPEQPLVDGLANDLRDKGFLCFGPNKEAAEIEGNKSFSKSLMKQFNIPTAEFKIFNKIDKLNAITYVNNVSYPIVIKASGLAAGKGVLICQTQDEALLAINDMFENEVFGESGNEIVIEEFMNGLEASIFAITDGEDYVILPLAQDHKRIYDNDEGKNTGGMGAYAPASLITDKLMAEIEDKIISRTINALAGTNKKYNGCLYAGIMITKSGPKVVEFNCRFGDPETQVVLPIIEGDFLQLLYSTAKGKIDKECIKNSDSCAVCVVASSKGYPDNYEKGKIISGIDNVDDDDTIVFHAGTMLVEDKIVTNGGRVFGITKIDRKGDIKDCKKKVYESLSKITFDGIYFRTDISDKAFDTV